MAVAFGHPLIGIMQFMGYFFQCFLFMGLMIPEENIIYPFRYLCAVRSDQFSKGSDQCCWCGDIAYPFRYFCAARCVRRTNPVCDSFVFSS
jgi:hypothetical protein